MDIVDKICEDAIVEDQNGNVLKENQPVIEFILVDQYNMDIKQEGHYE